MRTAIAPNVVSSPVLAATVSCRTLSPLVTSISAGVVLTAGEKKAKIAASAVTRSAALRKAFITAHDK